MPHYVDGFVVPVPIDKIDAYRTMTEAASKIWLEHDALQFVETIADNVKPGKLTSFPQSMQMKKGETIAFSYIVYASREQRDSVNAKVMEDPRLKAMMESGDPPFDPQRMFFGGFTTLVELGRS